MHYVLCRRYLRHVDVRLRLHSRQLVRILRSRRRISEWDSVLRLVQLSLEGGLEPLVCGLGSLVSLELIVAQSTALVRHAVQIWRTCHMIEAGSKLRLMRRDIVRPLVAQLDDLSRRCLLYLLAAAAPLQRARALQRFFHLTHDAPVPRVTALVFLLKYQLLGIVARVCQVIHPRYSVFHNLFGASLVLPRIAWRHLPGRVALQGIVERIYL